MEVDFFTDSLGYWGIFWVKPTKKAWDYVNPKN